MMLPQTEMKIFEFFERLGLDDQDVAFLLDITKSYMSYLRGGGRAYTSLLVDKLSGLFSFLEAKEHYSFLDFGRKYSETYKEFKKRKRSLLEVLKLEFVEGEHVSS